jgi:hypothetical protein
LPRRPSLTRYSVLRAFFPDSPCPALAGARVRSSESGSPAGLGPSRKRFTFHDPVGAGPRAPHRRGTARYRKLRKRRPARNVNRNQSDPMGCNPLKSILSYPFDCHFIAGGHGGPPLQFQWIVMDFPLRARGRKPGLGPSRRIKFRQRCRGARLCARH